MHPLKLHSNLQRCSILGLRDAEPHIKPTGGAEDQEYEEAKVIQILLGRKDFEGCLFVIERDAFKLNVPV